MTLKIPDPFEVATPVSSFDVDPSTQPATPPLGPIQLRSSRNRGIVVTALAGIGARGVSLATSILLVPVTLDYLGSERYGVWMTITSLVALLNFADIGMGYGLMNSLSRRLSVGDNVGAARDISSTMAVTALIALMLAGVFAIAYPLVSWSHLFNVDSARAAREVGPAIAIFAGSFLIGIPLQTAAKVQQARQSGYEAHLWSTVGNVLGVAGVLSVIVLEGSLPWIVLAFSGLPITAALANHLFLFHVRRPSLRPLFKLASRTAALQLIKPGLFFFGLQVTVAAAYSSDHLVIARILGPDAVTEYSVPFRVFHLIFLISILSVSPLWPAYSEAAERGDFAWVRRTFKKSLLYTFALTFPAATLLVVLGRPLIELWVGEGVQPSYVLLAGLGLWTIIGSLGNAITMLLNGLGVIKIQAVFALLMAGANLVASIYLTRRIGVAGAIWGTAISFLLVFAIPISVLAMKSLSSLNQKASNE